MSSKILIRQKRHVVYTRHFHDTFNPLIFDTMGRTDNQSIFIKVLKNNSSSCRFTPAGCSGKTALPILDQHLLRLIHKFCDMAHISVH